MRLVYLAAIVGAPLLSSCGPDEAGTVSVAANAGGADAPAKAAGRVAGALTQAMASTSCKTVSSRYPWGRAELRTWTPSNPATFPGADPDSGAPFAARLIEAYGEDYGAARQQVILETADGCRRQYASDVFAPADRSVIDAELASRPTAPDPASYRVQYVPGLSSAELVAGGDLKLHATQHFSIWYGKDTRGDFYRTMVRQGRDPEQAIRETGAWLEKLWFFARDYVRSPTPFANSNDRLKMNIYICGSGRPIAGGDLNGCGAHAAEAMGISGWGLEKGSSTLAHEFGHMLQFYTGGFRDRPPAGVIWETHAQWFAFTVTPTRTQTLLGPDGPTFALTRYETYPFLAYLFNKDDTRDLIMGAWSRNLRDANGASQEDYLQTFVRLAKDEGIYPEGFKSFADDMGWFGMRAASRDFLNQSVLQVNNALQGEYNQGIARVATVRDPNVYAPKGVPLQWGTTIAELTPSAGTVTVTLTGGTRANEAAWRFGLVTVAANREVAYSTLGRAEGQSSGSVTLAVPSGAKLYLAVTATPYQYQSLGWANTGTRFPYRLKIDGATPK